MEIYPEQFPPEGCPDPIPRAEDGVFDANEDSDQPAVANHEGQAASRSPGRRIGETLPFAPDLGRSHVPPRKHPDILGDSRCPVIAVILFPDMEQGPAIVAEARRSNVHVLWGTDNLMNRLAAIAARKAYYPPNADDIRREVAAVTDGQVLYAEEARTSATGLRAVLAGTAGRPGGSQAGNPRRRHHHRARGHSDCPHRARPGDRRRQGPGTRELVQAPEPHETTGGRLPGMTARLRARPESRGSGRNSFTIQHNQNFKEQET